jgi:glycosyltransferase involved in cell wall biosynthesis
MSEVQISGEAREFLRSFQERHGRMPRVCHLGNIASNAYHAAKLLRLAGVEGEVLALHDYFVMSSPEWEEADMAVHPSNLFNPEWRQLDLRGYQRPRWFAQGSIPNCLEYTLTRVEGDQEAAAMAWRKLALENLTEYPEPDRRPTPLQRWAARLARLGRRAERKVALRVRAAVQAPDYWDRIEANFRQHFPSREDKLRPEDVLWASGSLGQWRQTLLQYDFVIGYSTYGLFPLLAGVPYLCLEHGTLRDIPFAPDAQGRSTALSYAMAEHVFVTNFDCLPKAEVICPGRYTYVNHPYHQDQAQPVARVGELRAEIHQELDADFLIFFPTRQDWVTGTGYADKANDALFHAFATLRKAGRRVGLILCEWGQNIAQSKDLLAQLGVERHVRWMPPVGAVAFNRHCQAVDLVADQFKLGAFGGVLFKAMCNRAPVISYLDEVQLGSIYPELPPVLNGKGPDELARLVAAAMDDPAMLKALGERGRAWVEAHHNGLETLDRMLRVFARVEQERQARGQAA